MRFKSSPCACVPPMHDPSKRGFAGGPRAGAPAATEGAGFRLRMAEAAADAALHRGTGCGMNESPAAPIRDRS